MGVKTRDFSEPENLGDNVHHTHNDAKGGMRWASCYKLEHGALVTAVTIITFIQVLSHFSL